MKRTARQEPRPPSERLERQQKRGEAAESTVEMTMRTILFLDDWALHHTQGVKLFRYTSPDGLVWSPACTTVDPRNNHVQD